MCALPVAGGVLVRLGERRIDVDGAEDLVESDAVPHRGNVFDDQVARVLADYGGPQNAVAAGHAQHFHDAMRRRRAATPFFAASGNRPSSTNEPMTPGDRIAEVESMCAICVPAFTKTSVPANMPAWLTQ